MIGATSITGTAQAAITSGVSISGGSSAFSGDTLGWRFEAQTDIDVLSLGVWDENGDRDIAGLAGLWTDSGTMLGQVSFNSGEGTVIDGFLYEDLAAAISLSAGEFYRVGSYIGGGGPAILTTGSVTDTAEVSYDQGYKSADFGWEFPGASASADSYFGANFRYEVSGSSSVPAPGIPALLLIGGLGFWLSGRRSR